MPARYASLGDRRAIIDRRAVAARIDAALSDAPAGEQRAALTAILRAALADGRAEIARRLDAAPTSGRAVCWAQSFLIDQIIRLIHDATVEHLYPAPNRSAGERLTLMALGGYGRAEMAPYSDVDIQFLTPLKRTGWTEQVIESILYSLWDLKLKVGHASRTLDEMMRVTAADLTVRTALLEARYIWGDQPLYAEAQARFAGEVMAGTAHDFIAAKLDERDARHRRLGDTRYLVEPNVKEGKGGLRDLHALIWIGKYLHRVATAPELVEAGLLTRAELRQFARAEDFLLAVRCHLHLISGRTEDRLTFDVQREVAARMRFADRPGKSAVERFMRLYFLHAKSVGDITGLFLAHLDEQRGEAGRRFIATNDGAEGALDGFVLDRGRIALPADDWFARAPIRLIELFALADREGREIHPNAMRAARRDAHLIDAALREDPRANALFLGVLTSPRDPETVLRWMNEANVFGRFVPDFGRVVAQMQFDMYHHYTVDEHSIRAIGLLAKIERGELKEDHPLTSVMIHQIGSRRALYVAVLLHDIAKGRGGDHSVLGAEVAERMGPRFGLSAAETETVAWLVRHHLLMSATAFKRDLADPKTIADFANQVQSMERLKLLLLLTVVDIRAVGPGTWNGWKRQLLTELYDAAEELLRLGHKQRGREQRIAEKRAAVAAELAMPNVDFDALAERLPDSFWIAEPVGAAAGNIAMLRERLEAGETIAITTRFDDARAATLVSVLAPDTAGLFYRLAGAVHLAGGNIIDARIHTTRDGWALDNFLVQDPLGRPFAEEAQMTRMRRAIAATMADRHAMRASLANKAHPLTRADAFRIPSSAVVDNRASNRFTVIEVSAHDRPALLHDLAYALFSAGVTLHSAHVSTYGERAVDTFYVTDLTGAKIIGDARVAGLVDALETAASG